MLRSVALTAMLAVVLASCGLGSPTVSDAQRVWCGSHPVAVVTAGRSLAIEPSAAVAYKAEVEQAQLDGDVDRATSLILQRVGESITGDSPSMADAHPDLTAMQSWEADSAEEWQRACIAAAEAE